VPSESKQRRIPAKRPQAGRLGPSRQRGEPGSAQGLPGTRCGLLGSHTWPLPASLGRSVRAPPLHHGWTLGGPGPSDCKVLPPPMRSRSSRPKLGKRHIWERARQRSDHPHRIHSGARDGTGPRLPAPEQLAKMVGPLLARSAHLAKWHCQVLLRSVFCCIAMRGSHLSLAPLPGRTTPPQGARLPQGPRGCRWGRRKIFDRVHCMYIHT
jgi:hypothetical protein